jgi:DtxR family manganese transport transcriptional regulator
LFNAIVMPRVVTRPSTASIRQAESFRRSRKDRALEIVQDYVEAIAELAVELGEVRVVDLARRMGVTHVTVNHTITRLQAAGYVSMEPYQAIFLTGPGQKLARECKERHETVVAFLRSLGVPEKTAEMDAEGIEHHVSPQTLAAFRAFLRKQTS